VRRNSQGSQQRKPIAHGVHRLVRGQLYHSKQARVQLLVALVERDRTARDAQRVLDEGAVIAVDDREVVGLPGKPAEQRRPGLGDRADAMQERQMAQHFCALRMRQARELCVRPGRRERAQRGRGEQRIADARDDDRENRARARELSQPELPA